MARSSSWNWEKSLTLIAGGLLTIVAIIMGLATAQMYATTSRIDALYSDTGNIKADVAKAAVATDYIRADLADVKTTLADMRASLGRIETRLSSAGPLPSPTRAVIVNDPADFGRKLQTVPLDGFAVYPRSPEDWDKLKAIIQGETPNQR